MSLKDAIAIRKKVAELCGYTELYYCEFTHAYILRGIKDGKDNRTPDYESSMDAILKVFDDYELNFDLQKRFDAESGEVGYFASNSYGQKFSDSAAKSMCYLFIHCMEQK